MECRISGRSSMFHLSAPGLLRGVECVKYAPREFDTSNEGPRKEVRGWLGNSEAKWPWWPVAQAGLGARVGRLSSGKAARWLFTHDGRKKSMRCRSPRR